MKTQPGTTAPGNLWHRLKGHWVTAAPASAWPVGAQDQGRMVPGGTGRRAVGWTGLGIDRPPPRGAAEIWDRRP